MRSTQELLQQGLDAYGLDRAKAEPLLTFAEMLLEKNQVMNLTAITEPTDVARLHLLDCAAVLLLFLPLFGQETAGTVRSVPLLTLTGIAPYLKAAYAAAAVALTGMGILSLILRDRPGFWARNGQRLSLLLNAAGTLLFMIGRQPYAAVFLFLCLAVKMLLTAKIP